MQMTLLASIIILVSVFPVQQKNPETRNQRKIPMELWCSGDDVFTKQLCQTCLSAFASTRDFDFQEENKPGNLIVTIAENVGWKDVGKRTKITYVVEFSTFDDRVFMTRKGWCWDKDYPTCANQILKQTKIAARRLPR